MPEGTPELLPLSLDSIYADPLAARSLEGHEAEHRARVRQALTAGEPIYAYWWDTDFTGLVLATDRRLLQFPKIRTRKNLLFWEISFDTWRYPYDFIKGLTIVPGSFFEFPRIVLKRARDADALIVITRSRLSKAEQARLAAFTATIERLVERWQTDESVRAQALAAAEATATTSLTAELKELFDLYRSGALSEEEYQQAKARLLQD